ncbi:hypothetical protein ACFYY8_11860 [Streptosporangium sp. NPDC001559]|uniref:hypothetical protein n=1 Tax=Streptosporangium sp. NPDC001559 TaxID=3366187 RepID=UPI0036EB6F31
MSDTETATPPGPAPADPVEPTEPPAPAPAEPSAPEPAPAGERPEGIPAAHLATGGLSGGAVALGAIYQLLGLPGLVGGAVLAGGGTVAYLRHRYQKNTSRRGGYQPSPSRSSSHRGSSGRRTGPGVASALFSGGRSPGGRSGRSGGLFGGSSGGRGAGRSLFGKGGRGGGLLGGSGRGSGGSGGGGGRTKAGKTPKTPKGPKAPKAPAVQRAAQKAGAATRAFGHRARKVGGGAVQQTRKVAAWANKATKGKAGKAFGHAGRLARAGGRAAARHARKAGAWVDRRSGRRYSTAWKAMREAKGFRAARRRGAAVLGGRAAPLTASVMAFLAWIVGRYKARKAARASTGPVETPADDPTPDPTADAAETNTPAEDESPGVVHGGEGELPITATVTCPRCQTKHTITVARTGDAHTVECPCGYRIRFTRHPEPATANTPTSTPTGAPTGPVPSTPAPTAFRRRTVSNNPLAAATAELNGAASGYAPDDMWTVAREIEQLPEIPANVALALRTYTMRLQGGEYPIEAPVGEALHDLYAAMAQLVPLAEQVVTVFRTVHAADLARGDAPRTGEPKWDVGRM